MKRPHAIAFLIAAGALLAGPASAQSIRWSAKLGISQVTPQVHSGEVSAPALPHSKADVLSDTAPVFAVGYALSDSLSAELHIGQPFKHDIVGAGALAGTGKLANFEALAPTAMLSYRFNAPKALFRPYVAAGLSYVYFADETGSGQLTAITQTGGAPVSFTLDNKLALTVQAGLEVNITPRTFADFSFTKTRLRTDATFSTGQTMDMRLDPKSVSVAFGYRF